MKYIFVAGAPGSKWSSVVKNIYYSPSINQSDYRDDWTYYHDASGEIQLMHLGAYFDPGMACPLPEDLTILNRQRLEDIFDYPFKNNSQGVRIIKSHIFCYESNIQHLREQFVDCPIILVHRGNDSCLGWWVKCGHFNITYPLYHEYYKDLKHMAKMIEQQNAGLLEVWGKYQGHEPQTNKILTDTLNIETPPLEYTQDYASNDIRVKVI